jgi:hypothetical protein
MGMLSMIGNISEVRRAFHILHEAVLAGVRFSSVSEEV